MTTRSEPGRRPRERALELLERHIASGRENGDDPAATARECLVTLEGIGYRPTEARPPADWKLHGAGPGSRPPADLLESLRADLDAKAGAFKVAQKAREEAEGAA